MEKHEGTNAVSNARIAIVILAWIFILAGIILMMVGFVGESSYYGSYTDILWSYVIGGAGCIVSGAFCFIINAILKGFWQIVRASELYMISKEEKESKKVEDKTIRLPMQQEYKRPTNI